MQAVSSAWRSNQNQILVDESFLEVTLELADPEALSGASATDNGSMFFSNTAQIVDGLSKNVATYAMLEQNQWILDQSRDVLGTSWGDMGFVSAALSSADLSFSIAPRVLVSFDQIHEPLIPGITIVWGRSYGEYAVDFTVTAYNGSTAIAHKVVTGNADVTSYVFIDIKNYDQIAVTVQKWQFPYRRARIESVLAGIAITYRKNNLISFSQEMIADPLSASLPKYSIAYDVDNVSGDFDPNNLTGLSPYLIERQRIEAQYGYKFDNTIEWIPAGTFFLSEWRSPQNGVTASFKARDTLEFMTAEYYKGVYAPSGVSLYSLALSVLTEANLPLKADGKVNWYLDDSLKTIYATAPLPRASLAVCLQIIANAACCSLRFDRKGLLIIAPAPIVDFVGSATVTSNGEMPFSNVSEIIDNSTTDLIQYATLETSKWILNSEFATLNENSQNVGYASAAICDMDGFFSSPPILTIAMQREITNLIPELTIKWGGGEFAIDFTVTAYNGGTIVASTPVTGNANIESVVNINMQYYNRITITIHKWNVPGRRARIQAIPTGPEYQISTFNSFRRPEIELSKPLAGVTVAAIKHSVETQVTVLFQGDMLIDGTRTIVINYAQAATNVAASVTGGVLVAAKYYSLACELTITGGDVNITITGNQLRAIETLATLNTGKSGDVQPVKNPLVNTLDRAQIVAEWVATHIMTRTNIKANWRADPRMDVLDIVSVQNKYSWQPVQMTRVNYKYNGAFHGSGEGRTV